MRICYRSPLACSSLRTWKENGRPESERGLGPCGEERTSEPGFATHTFREMVATRTLAKVALVGAAVTASAGLWVHGAIEGRLKGAPYFKEALRRTRHHPAALQLLGEPIKVGRIDLRDTDANRCDADAARFRVPLKGPRDRGELFLEASNDSPEGWRLTRLALRVDAVPGEELSLLGPVGG